MGMGNNGGMALTGETPDFSTRILLQSYQQSTSSKAGGSREGNEIFLMKYLFRSQKGF
jgi:hypothetical protein